MYRTHSSKLGEPKPLAGSHPGTALQKKRGTKLMRKRKEKKFFFLRVAVEAAISSGALVVAAGDVEEGTAVLFSHLIEQIVEESERGLSIVQQLVVDESHETSKGRRTRRSSVHLSREARAVVRSIVRKVHQIVVSFSKKKKKNINNKFLIFSFFLGLPVEGNIGIGSHGGVEGVGRRNLVVGLEPAFDGVGLVVFH
jgi:hypothetical protein